MCLKTIKKWCKEHIPLVIIILIILVTPIIFGFFFVLFTPPGESVETPIGVDPQKLEVSLSPGENYTKTISIRANETGNVALNAIGPIKDWVKFSNNENVPVEAGRTDYANVEFVIPENATPGEYMGAIKITHNGSIVLFSWDDVLGIDSKRLRRFLKDLYKIDWAENTSISKSHDNKTITIIIKKSPAEALIKYLSGAETFKHTIAANITIDEKGAKATLKIKDRDALTSIVNKENDKRNIYRSVDAEIPIILTIEPRETIPKNVSILLVPQNQGKGYAYVLKIF